MFAFIFAFAVLLIIILILLYSIQKHIVKMINIKSKIAKISLFLIIAGLFVFLIAIRNFFVFLIFYSSIIIIFSYIIKKIFPFLKENKILNLIALKGFSVFIIAFIITISGYINTKCFYIKQYNITAAKQLKTPIKITAVSDIHLGTSINKNELEKIVEKINNTNPDIVCLLGDIYDESTSKELLEYSYKCFKNIKAKSGSFYITGNHDLSADHINNIKDGLESSGIKVLINDYLYLEDLETYIVGINDKRYKESMVYFDIPLHAIMSNVDASKPVIVLSHRPEDIENAKSLKTDLFLSGHTHRGQIFPFNFIASAFNEQFYGIKSKDGFTSIVSSGAGTWGFPFRTVNRSEIIEINITKN